MNWGMDSYNARTYDCMYLKCLAQEHVTVACRTGSLVGQSPDCEHEQEVQVQVWCGRQKIKFPTEP